jgi:uncharacterized membrane protein YphA (DoxX/SURF4 family)
MGFGQWLACNVTPLLLRLGLAAVFIWAGYAKLAYNDPVSGEDAAILANMGVIKLATAAPAPKEPAPEAPAPAPEPAPEETKPAEPPTEEKPIEETKPQTMGGDGQMGVVIRALAQDSSNPPATMAPAPAAFVAEDFPTPVMVGRVYKIALVLHKAAHPADPARQLWPTKLAESRTIKTLAWLAALTEIAGGTLVLFGFLTRLAALGLASTMCVAMLLTTIGPAAVSGEGFLGFLPPHRMSDPEGWQAAWNPMLMQWCLLMMSVGLVCAGAGGLSLDRLIFGRQKHKTAAPPKST